MKTKRVLTIFRKDAVEAIRDARVLVAIVVPLGLALFYSFLFEGTTDKPEATVSHTAATSALPDALRAAAGSSVDLTFEEVAGPEEVRSAVKGGNADLGLLAPPGFDEAIGRGEKPNLVVVLPESSSSSGEYAVTFLDGALMRMAGQEPPASVRTETLEAEDGQSVFAEIGPRRYFVVASVVFLIAMIGLLVVPVILADEAEKKTLDALTMVASYAEVITAKALVGLLYTAVAVPLLLVAVRMSPDDAPTFAGGTALLAVALMGFGLLLGGLFRNANQLNTWSGVFLIPVAAPAFMVGFDLPGAVEGALALIPTGAATRLALNGLSGEALFPDVSLSYLVVVLWAAAGYALLAWTLRRREA